MICSMTSTDAKRIHVCVVQPYTTDYAIATALTERVINVFKLDWRLGLSNGVQAKRYILEGEIELRHNSEKLRRHTHPCAPIPVTLFRYHWH